ncbi:magnesium/cobalt transporter CorA [Candidatus Peregrinibacteria bacterium]|nr:magnesium/cobalt transporter CorA [Candidatus Peregrinibacteria bacterium]
MNIVMNDQIQKIEESGIAWENIVAPTEKSMEYLAKKHKFHHLDLEDCLSRRQRPKIDEYDKYLFIVLQFPYFDKKSGDLKIDDIKIFIGQSFVITVHPGNKTLNTIFTDIKRKTKLRKKYMGQTTGYLLYNILDDMFSECFKLYEKLNEEIVDIEEQVFNVKDTRDMLNSILSIKKDIITYRRIIIPQRTLVAQLEHKNKKFLPDTLEVYFDDIVDKVEKLHLLLATSWDVIGSIHETNESIVSHNTNNIIKVLTIISVVMMPLTFITGLYGMNVDLPVAEHPWAFLLILGILAGIVITMVVFFRHKKWM